MQLKQMVDGRKLKQLGGKFIPNINFAELLGWGLGRAVRELHFYDMLTTPNYPDSFQQNWLLTRGARALRIDVGHGRRVELTQHRYIQHLREMLCLPDAPGAYPDCDAHCRPCIAFRWSPMAHPPGDCTLCYACVRCGQLRGRLAVSDSWWQMAGHLVWAAQGSGGGGGGVEVRTFSQFPQFPADFRGGDRRDRHRGPAARVPHHRSGG